MTDQELANKIVASGVGYKITLLPPHSGTSWGLTDGDCLWVTLDGFVRDWRVAGAMLEKCFDNSMQGTFAFVEIWEHVWGMMRGGEIPLPRAINEGCVEALKVIE